VKECNQRDRWQDDDIYAIMKKGNKRAIKLCTSEKQAKAFCKTNINKDKLTIELRKSVPRRCENYCSVSHYCHYYRDMHPEMFKEAI